MTSKKASRQRKIYEFLQEYVEANGYPPTVREIGRAVGIKSTSLVSYYLKSLDKKGLIDREPSVSRGIRLADDASDQEAPPEVEPGTMSIPYLGYIVASAPIPVNPLEGDETIEINRALFGREADDLFALRVKGNSMIDALIHDGDLVVLRQQEHIENGQMAAVWIDNDLGETTLKKVYREGKRVRLQPANPSMDPIYIPAEQVQIKGKVVMVIRQLE
jgi:repressor LexA